VAIVGRCLEIPYTTIIIYIFFFKEKIGESIPNPMVWPGSVIEAIRDHEGVIRES
jgi:hypothetical protein